MERFKFSSIGINSENYLIFVLSNEGLVMKCRIKGSIQNSDFLESLNKSDIMDVTFMEDRGSMIIKDGLGLWSYERDTQGWAPFFLVWLKKGL